MKVNPAIFKSYDIRGRVGDEINVELTNKVGQAFADWLPEQGPVAVGYDMRPDSKELAMSLINGLLKQGRDVWNIGQVASDMIYFTVGKYDLAGGAVVTASHNPGQYNGIKLCREKAGGVGLDSGLGSIRDLVISEEFKQVKIEGKIINQDVMDDWIEHVVSFVDTKKLPPIKIVADAGNGMAGLVLKHLVDKLLPLKITPLYWELDGSFPNHEANPLKFETLSDMINEIKTNHLDGGVAFDGDGDRAFLVDETGEVLTGGVMSAMLSEYFLEKYPKANIVYDARNSRTVPEVIEEHAGIPIITKVGHSNIKIKMKEVDAPFGGEASGHFYFRDNWYADSGIIAAIIGLFVAGKLGKKLSEIREYYSHYEAIPETNFEVKNTDTVIKEIKARFLNRGELSELDGITFSLDSAWFNIRASNTEPVLRLNAEADKKEKLDKLVNEIRDIIEA